MAKIVNLTPPELNFMMDNEDNVNISPSGIIVRVVEKSDIFGSINGIPIIKKPFGKVEGLPEPELDTIFIVGLLAAQAIKDRNDVFVIGESIRNERGQVVGAKSLAVA